ncbi:hypothetical protein FRC14_007267 [Serendipita sp. 396]|nr:hypothetical protein FRC14_007267 [Serendipita sp. 396]
MDVSQPLPATLINLGLSIADLELYATRVRSGEYLSIAGITLLIYDYFCTFEEEWGHIWRQKPRLAPAKVLFAINRYFPLFTLVTRFYVCKFGLLSATGFAGVINVAVVEVILLLRVWVIYSRKRWIGIMLWSFFAVGLALALVVKYLQPHTNLPFVKPPSYDNNRCTKVAAGEMFFIYGIVCLSESVFFSMLVYKAYQTSKGASRTPILKALILQGTMYYFVVLIILAITMFAPFSEELYFPIANALIIVPITSVACNRLILSLRGMVFSNQVVRGADMGLSRSTSRSQSKGTNGIRPATALRSVTQSSSEPAEESHELDHSFTNKYNPNIPPYSNQIQVQHQVQYQNQNQAGRQSIAFASEHARHQYTFPTQPRPAPLPPQQYAQAFNNPAARPMMPGHTRHLTMDSVTHKDFLPSVTNSPSWQERRPSTAPDRHDVSSKPSFTTRLGGLMQRPMGHTPEEQGNLTRYPSGGPKSIHPMVSSTAF